MQQGETKVATRKRVTVFGGTGYLGRAVVECLTAAGHRVRVAARHADPALTATDAVEFCPVDVRTEDDVAGALSAADAAVNAVSLYVERRDATFEQIHVEAARRIARLARAQGVGQLVQISGIGVDPASPSAYVRARARGEAVVRDAFPTAAILRPGMLVSPEGGMLETLDAVTRLPFVPLFGRGLVRLQPVDVTDVARAVREVLRGEVTGIIELGGREILSYRELLEAIMATGQRRRPLLPIPMLAWHVIARMLGPLPSPPVTRDQLELLSRDNVVAPDTRGFEALGLKPLGIRDVLRERARNP